MKTIWSYEIGTLMKVSLESKLQDMWVGAYWKNGDYIFHLWICVIPCLPIHIEWMKV
jgi:hypothetical protein